ncbi:MAG: hypothetical protein L6R00_19245 [Phycisphaerae bacterium]|nr:hypothetical protein [Phycisphaerae bacterium]
MAMELMYTSAPRGLKPGSFGYCTVAVTNGMPPPLIQQLEDLSGYNRTQIPGVSDDQTNPPSYAHWRIVLGGLPYSVLSHVRSEGFDYSKRRNKFAHHVVVQAHEQVDAGPAWVFMQSGFIESTWSGEPRTIMTPKALPAGENSPRTCARWESAAGDPGWAGTLVEAFLLDASRPVYVIYQPPMDVLPLIDEALALLPPKQRWNVTFSTHFMNLRSDLSCTWRFCIAGGAAARNAPANATSGILIDLTGSSKPVPPRGGRYTEAARTGRLPPPEAAWSETLRRPAPDTVRGGSQPSQKSDRVSQSRNLARTESESLPAAMQRADLERFRDGSHATSPSDPVGATVDERAHHRRITLIPVTVAILIWPVLVALGWDALRRSPAQTFVLAEFEQRQAVVESRLESLEERTRTLESATRASREGSLARAQNTTTPRPVEPRHSVPPAAVAPIGSAPDQTNDARNITAATVELPASTARDSPFGSTAQEDISLLEGGGSCQLSQDGPPALAVKPVETPPINPISGKLEFDQHNVECTLAERLPPNPQGIWLELSCESGMGCPIEAESTDRVIQLVQTGFKKNVVARIELTEDGTLRWKWSNSRWPDELAESVGAVRSALRFAAVTIDYGKRGEHRVQLAAPIIAQLTIGDPPRTLFAAGEVSGALALQMDTSTELRREPLPDGGITIGQEGKPVSVEARLTRSGAGDRQVSATWTDNIDVRAQRRELQSAKAEEERAATAIRNIEVELMNLSKDIERARDPRRRTLDEKKRRAEDKRNIERKKLEEAGAAVGLAEQLIQNARTSRPRFTKTECRVIHKQTGAVAAVVRLLQDEELQQDANLIGP